MPCFCPLTGRQPGLHGGRDIRCVVVDRRGDLVASAAPREGLSEGLAKTVTEEAVDERVEAGVEVGQSMAHDLHTIYLQCHTIVSQHSIN